MGCNNFETHEEFIRTHAVENIKSDTLVTVLKDILIRLNILLWKCRGQCYDGASNMAGIRQGVPAQIQSSIHSITISIFDPLLWSRFKFRSKWHDKRTQAAEKHNTYGKWIVKAYQKIAKKRWNASKDSRQPFIRMSWFQSSLPRKMDCTCKHFKKRSW